MHCNNKTLVINFKLPSLPLPCPKHCPSHLAVRRKAGFCLNFVQKKIHFSWGVKNAAFHSAKCDFNLVIKYSPKPQIILPPMPQIMQSSQTSLPLSLTPTEPSAFTWEAQALQTIQKYFYLLPRKPQ